MSPKVKEKLQLVSQKEKCRELIANFKKSLELWFLSEADDEITFAEIQNASLEIILHGLNDDEQQQLNNNANSTSDSSLTCTNSYNNEPDLYTATKIIDDFEWVLNSVNIGNNSKCSKADALTSRRPPTPPLLRSSVLRSVLSQQKSTTHNDAKATLSKATQLTQWLRQNLHQSILFVFLQYLVSDKELLEEHYTDEAVLRQEHYVNALFIGMSAFETHQYGLLKQIDTLLKEGVKKTQHKRCNSQPNVIVLAAKKSPGLRHLKQPPTTLLPASHQRSVVLLAIRKTKSLPEFKTNCKDVKDVTDSRARPRCKTIADIKLKHTKPKRIPQVKVDETHWRLDRETTGILAPSSGESSYGGDVQQPSTSRKTTSNRNNSSTTSLHLNSTASTASSSSMCTSVSSSSSNTTAKHIQLINTDGIKIWTDHMWEQQKNKPQSNATQATPAQAIPPARHLSAHKPSKSLSPLNSFFSSLFSTPPSYTSWYTEHSSREENQMPETAIDTINCDNHANITPTLQSTPSSLSSTVFDKFLPIYGKKLRSRNSQNLFDDVNAALDYSTPVSLHTTTTAKDEPPCTLSSSSSPSANCMVTTKNCQSLTRFLQMSQSSRNNTELEKENAHFRISEAIISAIEHIKWNKQIPSSPQTDKQNREATPMATDCLSSSDSSSRATTLKNSANNDLLEGEHVPYAEDVSVELLSAEVVGLSLISKFDETQLPKVSELKWLVSDEDTPQNLLPMPDLSGNNPDEHLMHSVTRGTKYWAPPRQQIIFTDHATEDRKELLKRQNFRCAGCGMRVSPQYVQSFRYCYYLGKYHCTGCHRNQISATPAKILQNWDFKCYPVSVFAYRLLEQMSSYPLFYVPDLNPALYFRSKSLLSARDKRFQLKFVKDFIRTCRFALREQTYFESVPDYITGDIDNWSMSDFIDARSNCLQRSIDELILKCENHIFNCVLCTARGFLCEYCNVDSVIYPWDSRVVRCDRCGSCFHRNCWKSMSLCCRCQRIDKRQEEDDGIHDV